MATASIFEPAHPLPNAQLLRGLDRAAIASVLLLPLLLMHAHGIAEGAIAIADVCFLIRATVTGDWAWLRAGWMRIGLAWWAWVVLGSLPVPSLGLGEGGTPSLVQAIVNVRFLVLVAAMEHMALRTAAVRRWLYGLICACAIYIAVHSLAQFAFGRNLYGHAAAWGEILTGPFGKPRAGPPLSRILIPVLMPPVARLLDRPGLAGKAGALALVLAGVAIMVLINQRMPLALTGLGLLVAGLLLPRLRMLVFAAGIAVVVLVAGSVAFAPDIHDRLVGLTSQQLIHFPSSHYGELYTRSLEIGRQHPFTGLGGDGFRYGCPDPRYFRPTFDGAVANGGGTVICASHPHNPYMEALVNGGVLGFVLFAALAVAWMVPLGRGLWRRPDPLRVGLFAAAFIQLWPFASTSGFTSMPMGGWFFFLLGWGMAEARWQTRETTP